MKRAEHGSDSEGSTGGADPIEARAALARRQVDALAPSLPGPPFAGQLIQQDPNDEPASVLLERFRA